MDSFIFNNGSIPIRVASLEPTLGTLRTRQGKTSAGRPVHGDTPMHSTTPSHQVTNPSIEMFLFFCAENLSQTLVDRRRTCKTVTQTQQCGGDPGAAEFSSFHP